MKGTSHKPLLYEIQGGWAAQGDGWAVHGVTKEEALRKYEEAVREHEAISTLPLPSKEDAVNHEKQEAS